MRLAMAIMIAAAGAGLPASLPEQAAGWSAAGPAAVYDQRSIFEYLDGHGEVYLAYGMSRCLARRYAGPEGEGDVLVDVFELASSADAFGVFSHSRDGEAVSVGQGASLASGTLLFWKGRHFVSVYAERQSDRSTAAVLALGRALDAALAEQGELPALVGRLPRAGLDERSVVWLRHPRILDAHARLGAGNVLGVGPAVPAALGRYARGEEAAELVVVAYPDQAAADAATAAFASRLLGAGGAATRREDGWYAWASAAATPATRAFVLRASSRQIADDVLAGFGGGATP